MVDKWGEDCWGWFLLFDLYTRCSVLMTNFDSFVFKDKCNDCALLTVVNRFDKQLIFNFFRNCLVILFPGRKLPSWH